MSDQFASRIPLQSITVMRDGKLVTPEVGKPFPFTGKELLDIERVNPDAVRKPIDESTEADAEVAKATGKAAGKSGKAAAGDDGAL